MKYIWFGYLAILQAAIREPEQLFENIERLGLDSFKNEIYLVWIFGCDQETRTAVLRWQGCI
jgi:hypothetical protein